VLGGHPNRGETGLLFPRTMLTRGPKHLTKLGIAVDGVPDTTGTRAHVTPRDRHDDRVMKAIRFQGKFLALTLMTNSGLANSSVTSIRQSRLGCNLPSRPWRI
jgi:truncated hemoglobin YjbI